MLIEIHMLQNFAPSNLNRDDTGSPKDCEFGGYRRARISSQCFKRAIREIMKDDGLLPPEDLASRTKRIVDKALVPRLVDNGKDAVEAKRVATAALYHADLTVKPDGKTEYLLFMGAREIDRVVALCLEQWDRLLIDGTTLLADTAPASDEEGASAPKKGRGAKAVAKDKKMGEKVKDLLDGGKAADLALFGRMIANLPDKNVDGSCQVAHALSTNAVDVEFDFYTAVDDLKPDDTAGADMLGTIEFNSACYYRYANVDMMGLRRNLGGDDELARRTLEGFLRAAVAAVPTGKQNSMAAQNPPSLVFAVARRAGLWSLANAFVKPIRPGQGDDLIQRSTAALDGYWGKLTKMYGTGQIAGAWVCALGDDGLSALTGARVDSIDELIGATVRAAFSEGGLA